MIVRYSIRSKSLPYEKAEELAGKLREKNIHAHNHYKGIDILPINEEHVAIMNQLCSEYGITPVGKIFLLVKCDLEYLDEVMDKLREAGYERDRYLPTGLYGGGLTVFGGWVEESKIDSIKNTPHVLNTRVYDFEEDDEVEL